MSRRRIQFEGSLPCDPVLLFEAIEELFPKKAYKSEQEHMDIIKENNLTSSKQWNKYYQNNNLTEQGYLFCPWRTFNKTTKQFFEEIYGKKKTEQEHIKIIKENNIRSSDPWRKYWKDNNLTEQSYFVVPWAYFKKSAKQFFEDIFGKKIYKTEQEHIDFIIKNNLRGSKQWYDYWKDNNLQEQGYLYCPWRTLNKTIKQFFEEIFGKKKTEQEHIDLIIKNNITVNEQWRKYWKDNNLTEQGYLSLPWLSFKKTAKEFFEEIYGKKKTEKEHIEFIIKNNNITGNKRWYDYWKDNNLQEQGYLSDPWRSFDKTKKQFFAEIRKAS